MRLRRGISCVLTVLMLLTAAPGVFAIDAGKPFDDPVLQTRYESIIAEVRCLVCQNESIKDSNAFLASDLRREISRMLEEGMADGEIYDFLVDRYGEFVLYRPRTSGKTLILWVAPGLFLLGGAYQLARIVRRRTALPIGDDS